MTAHLRACGLVVGGVAVALAAASCSSAMPTENPEVMRLGATVLQYKGPEVDAVLSYRFAGANLGADWLLLDLALTGNSRSSLEVRGEEISLRTPSGEEIPLPSQEEFGQEYGRLASTIERANLAGEPLDYWSGRTLCSIQLLTIPGAGLAFPSVWVNDQRVCEGRLYFPVTGGVQAGHWELRINLPESKVRIPFTLAEH